MAVGTCDPFHGGLDAEILCDVTDAKTINSMPGLVTDATELHNTVLSCRDLLPGFSGELEDLLGQLIENASLHLLSFNNGPLFVCAYRGGKAAGRYVILGCNKCLRHTMKLYYGCNWEMGVFQSLKHLPGGLETFGQTARRCP